MEYANVLINWKRIAELDGKSLITIIPRETVHSVELRYGFQAKRTWLQVPFAIFLIGVGLLPARLIINWFATGGESVFRTFTLLILMFPLGLWMLREALARGYYLAVQTDEGNRKIAFARSAKFDEIKDFLERASDELGCPIAIVVNQGYEK